MYKHTVHIRRMFMWVREGWETRTQGVFIMYCWLRIYRVVYKSVLLACIRQRRLRMRRLCMR